VRLGYWPSHRPLRTSNKNIYNEKKKNSSYILFFFPGYIEESSVLYIYLVAASDLASPFFLSYIKEEVELFIFPSDDPWLYPAMRMIALSFDFLYIFLKKLHPGCSTSRSTQD
jgi:hypothetical protein